MKSLRNFIALTLFVFCTSYVTQAQDTLFRLTPEGLISTENKEATFIVVERPGKSQQDLFDMVKRFTTQFFVSPKDVLSESGNEMISINGISKKDVIVKKGLAYIPITMNYTIVFHFKDGKVRVDIPSINSMTGESYTVGGNLSGLYQLNISKGSVSLEPKREEIVIFGKNKTKTEAKVAIEEFFNTFVTNALTENNAKEEEW
jgi:hypothetical protein